MSSKVHQLDLFSTDKEIFEQMVGKSIRGLFARETQRKNEIAVLKSKIDELEDVVFRMDNRLRRISEEAM